MQDKYPIVVYADINCPFCFVLHERLNKMELLDKVDWRTIEHAPNNEEAANSLQKTSQLDAEYQLVIQRANDVIINNPHFVPNTRIANVYIQAVTMQYPDLLSNFRLAIYRGLWQSSLNIENENVLNTLLNNLGITSLTISDNNVILECWQREWQEGDFDFRIPSMINKKNEVMLGLQHSESIRSFIDCIKVEPCGVKTTCKFMPGYRVCIFTKEKLPINIQSLTSSENFLLEIFSNLSQLLEQVQLNKVDIVLLDIDHADAFRVCKALKSNDELYEHLPITFYSNKSDRGYEDDCLKLGALDFISIPSQGASLKSRLKNHIRNKYQLEILSKYAVRDGLTGLYNRREMVSCLEKEWRNACRYNLELGIIMLDIDHFKEYNDHYGHPMGDDVLRKLAEVFSSSLYRSEDFVARYGGEEFIIIMPNTSREALLKVANRIKKEIRKLFIKHDKSPISDCITMSFGLSITKAHADNNYQMLVNSADKALYSAKHNGRNRIEEHILYAPNYN